MHRARESFSILKYHNGQEYLTWYFQRVQVLFLPVRYPWMHQHGDNQTQPPANSAQLLAFRAISHHVPVRSRHFSADYFVVCPQEFPQLKGFLLIVFNAWIIYCRWMYTTGHDNLKLYRLLSNDSELRQKIFMISWTRLILKTYYACWNTSEFYATKICE